MFTVRRWARSLGQWETVGESADLQTAIIIGHTYICPHNGDETWVTIINYKGEEVWNSMRRNDV